MVDKDTFIPQGYMNATLLKWDDATLIAYRGGGLQWSQNVQSGVWLYNYDFTSGTGELSKIPNKQELSVAAKDINESGHNRYRKPNTEKWRDWAKGIVKQH